MRIGWREVGHPLFSPRLFLARHARPWFQHPALFLRPDFLRHPLGLGPPPSLTRIFSLLCRALPALLLRQHSQRHSIIRLNTYYLKSGCRLRHTQTNKRPAGRLTQPRLRHPSTRVITSLPGWTVLYECYCFYICARAIKQQTNTTVLLPIISLREQASPACGAAHLPAHVHLRRQRAQDTASPRPCS